MDELLATGDFRAAAFFVTSARQSSDCGALEARSLEAISTKVAHSFWQDTQSNVMEMLGRCAFSDALAKIGSALASVVMMSANSDDVGVLKALELQVLEAQAKCSSQAIFHRSIGKRLERARPRKSTAQEVAEASSRTNRPPATLKVGTETHTMIVRTRDRVEVAATGGLEVVTSQQPHPQRKDASIVSFVVVPSLRDPFDTSLYGAQQVSCSLHSHRLDHPSPAPLPALSS